MMITNEEVTAALAQFNPQIKLIDNQMWAMPFDVAGNKHNVLLFLGAHQAYFVAACPISSEKLKAKPEGLTQETLAKILRANSDVMLAKIDYTEFPDGQFVYAAVSHCSIDNWTGDKLVQRMSDCARLANEVETRVGS